jgi:uncharacterized membrane protein
MPEMDTTPLDYARPKSPRIVEPLAFSASLSLMTGIGAGPAACMLSLFVSRGGTAEGQESASLIALVSVHALSLAICVVSLVKVIRTKQRRSIRFAWAGVAIAIGWALTICSLFLYMISWVPG